MINNKYAFLKPIWPTKKDYLKPLIGFCIVFAITIIPYLGITLFWVAIIALPIFFMFKYPKRFFQVLIAIILIALSIATFGLLGRVGQPQDNSPLGF